MPHLDRMTRVIAAILLPIAVATLVGMVALWPTGEPPSTGVVDMPAEYPTARITAVDQQECGGTNEDRLPNGDIPTTVPCLRLHVVVLGGADDGRELEIWAPATVGLRDVPVGSRIVLVHYLETETEPEVWAWYDFARTIPLLVLAGVFALVVIGVARMRGLRALVGLVLAFAVIGAFMLPALLRGEEPLAVGLVGSAAIMFVVLYLAHGFSLRTSVALLGTFTGRKAAPGRYVVTSFLLS